MLIPKSVDKTLRKMKKFEKDHLPPRIIQEIQAYAQDLEHDDEHVHYTGKNDHYNLGASLEGVIYDEESDSWKMKCLAHYSYTYTAPDEWRDQKNVVSRVGSLLPDGFEYEGDFEWKYNEEIPYFIELLPAEKMAEELKEKCHLAVSDLIKSFDEMDEEIAETIAEDSDSEEP